MPSQHIPTRVPQSARISTSSVNGITDGGLPCGEITRSFTSFSQAAQESADSRVYAAIHFPTACEDGLILGRKIGERVVTLDFQPAQM